jgi:hypothetical protein
MALSNELLEAFQSTLKKEKIKKCGAKKENEQHPPEAKSEPRAAVRAQQHMPEALLKGTHHNAID